MTLREKQSAFDLMTCKLVIYANEVLGLLLVCLEWGRSAEQQAINYARGSSKVRYSKHQDWLAKDYCFLGDLQDDGKINWDVERYRPLGEYWEKLGGRWGGRFGDDPTTQKIEGWDAGHFEFAG